MQTNFASTNQSSDLADDDLVQQAKIGDPGAFETLFERYSTLLFPLVSRMVRDEHIAHDVLQHVFLQLYRSLPILVPGGTLKAWLIKVARHRSIDELRRRRYPLFSEIEPFPNGGEYSFLTKLLDPDRQPEEQVELHELRQRILDAIKKLPLRYRPIVQLRYDTSMSFHEIGQVLSIPETTAKTYFYRAKKQLRILLESEFAYY